MKWKCGCGEAGPDHRHSAHVCRRPAPSVDYARADVVRLLTRVNPATHWDDVVADWLWVPGRQFRDLLRQAKETS